MTPYYDEAGITIYHGDCRDVLPELEKVDAVITDPPYGLKFMGKEWDHGIPGVHFWELIRDAMKPGAHLLAFGGTRTFHRLTCAIEDAGFEIRDCLMWVYGSGFPKSLDVGKAIEKAAGVEPTEIRPSMSSGILSGEGDWNPCHHQHIMPEPQTEGGKRWQGWGTALKPAYEPIVLARKPLEGTVAENVLMHGVGGLNIDGCRVSSAEPIQSAAGIAGFGVRDDGYISGTGRKYRKGGRWPANLIHDGSDEVMRLFPQPHGAGSARSGSLNPQPSSAMFGVERDTGEMHRFGDSGSAARFFYCAKASKRERGEGNTHPTVKPLALMRYLCRLVTPPKGIVLDPFAGSFSTLVAARDEGFGAIGIESDGHCCEIGVERLGQKVLAL